MKKININILIQLIGMLGVIGSLIFVGMQMRQSQQIALASQHQARTQMWMDQVNTHTEAGLAYRNYEAQELYVAVNQLHAALPIFENDFVQNELGLMEEELWQEKQGVIEMLGGVCEMQLILPDDLPRELLDLFKKGSEIGECRPVLDLFTSPVLKSN